MHCKDLIRCNADSGSVLKKIKEKLSSHFYYIHFPFCHLPADSEFYRFPFIHQPQMQMYSSQLPKTDIFRQGSNARKVISEVYATFVMQCTVSGR